MTIVLLACIVGCASSIPAASPSKREKIERVMQLQGVYETMNHQREVGREQMVSIFQQQLDAMRDEFHAAATRSATPLYLAEIERRTSGSMERALTEFLEFLRLQRRLNR